MGIDIAVILQRINETHLESIESYKTPSFLYFSTKRIAFFSLYRYKVSLNFFSWSLSHKLGTEIPITCPKFRIM
ncbi:hypothetical protein F0720_26720 [Bacillus anthracis]|nr:hypothetical protein [Bacillus anthracis]QDQ03903.1 hypothetical protein EKQ63_01735 [Bacillus sp. BD59S]MDR4313806.1 hypothetical protein [Bacillus anthracis]MDR4334969.1 hypothetical protein [Bacillus anthracis]MDR4357556.1 hypothetical protein [Bacillus anthracis]